MNTESLKIVGKLNGQPIYEVPSVPSTVTSMPSSACQANFKPCLSCILDDLLPMLAHLDRNMEVTYQALLQVKQIRIDDGVTELHVLSTIEQLHIKLAVASAMHDTLVALYKTARANLQ